VSSGDLPSTVSNLAQLQQLYLAGNLGLSDSSSLLALTRLSKLTYLDLRSCSFSGSLSVLAKLTSLSSLSLQYNSFNGTLDVLSVLTALTQLEARGNKLTGAVTARVRSFNDLDRIVSSESVTLLRASCVVAVSDGQVRSPVLSARWGASRTCS
jgi:hypothetical protein